MDAEEFRHQRQRLHRLSSLISGRVNLEVLPQMKTAFAVATLSVWTLALLIGIGFAVVGEVNGNNNQTLEILNLRAESQALASELGALKSERVSLKSQQASLETERDSLAGELGALKSQRASLETERDSLTGERDLLLDTCNSERGSTG